MISLLSTITFSTNWTQILILKSRNPKVIFLPKKQTEIGKDGQKRYEPFENNDNHHELLQVPFNRRHLGFELTCLST